MLIWGAVSGLLVGLLSSFFGVGGGVVAVPIMYTLFSGITTKTVIASSLGMICMNSVINLTVRAKNREFPKMALALPMGIGVIIGGQIGGHLALFLQAYIVKKIFGVSLVLVLLRLIFFKSEKIEGSDYEPPKGMGTVVRSSSIGLFGGILAGLTGLGGGIIFVPALMVVFKMPFSKIPLYSNVAMFFGTLSALSSFVFVEDLAVVSNFYPEYQIGHWNIFISTLFVLGSIVTAPIGTRLSRVCPPGLSRKLFGTLIFLVIIRIFMS